MGYSLKREGDELRYVAEGDVVISRAESFKLSNEFKKELSESTTLVLDCSGIGHYDSYFLVLRGELEREAEKAGKKFEAQNMKEDITRFYELFEERAPKVKAVEKKTNFLIEYIMVIGDVGLNFFRDFYAFVSFFGTLTIKMIGLIFKPGEMRWKDFPQHFTRSGVNAVPITLLIVFLIGLITGYQGAIQLAEFGADIFIANLIGISITRELSPLMVAILVAGRSGSAFAAEIGTMKVAEEIDALTTMGFDVMKFLVLPRVLAVVIAMPILVLLCDLVGILGGLISAISALDITMTTYFNQLQLAVMVMDVITGLIKSLVFGFLIAMMGCFRGLQVSGGAESVGRYTTSSVVSSVFLIILVDAVFTFVFQSLGI